MSTVEQITEPGVYRDLDEETYHGQRESLSNSGAKLLLPPSCPAIFHWQREHGQPHKEEFDFGRAAHRQVLGVGGEIVRIDARDWRTNRAKDERDAAYAAGQTPLLVSDAERVDAMAAALRAHPLASVLLDPAEGDTELSLFWHDSLVAVNEDRPVVRRARFDKVREIAGRTVVVDYKSTVSAEPEACSKAMHNYGYNRQGAWYRDAAVALDLGGPDTAFLLIFQEKTAPYLVTVAEPDEVALRAGRDLNRRAINTFAECTAAGTWPAYADDVITLPLPGWAERRYLEESA